MQQKNITLLKFFLPLFAITSIVLGLIASGAVNRSPQLFLSDASSSNISIVARGTNGEEKIALYLNNTPVQFWDLTTSFQTYTYTPPQSVTINQLSVEFLNDRWEPQNGINYDVQINHIIVNGERYDSEHATTASTGSWDQENWCAPGNKQTEWLHCSGSFTYNIPTGTVVGVDVTGTLPVCGNGVIESGEQCDDGNTVNGDGCSASCTDTSVVASDFMLSSHSAIATDSTVTIRAVFSDFAQMHIEYGTSTSLGINNPREESFSFKAHNQTIRNLLADTTYYYRVHGTNERGIDIISDIGFFATSSLDSGAAVCGNTIIEALEQCDDGNIVSGDGCSSSCQTEEIQSPICGDNNLDSAEQCDDGNIVSGDGCSDVCIVEVADAICGNDAKESGEQCDDGNLVAGDGCSSSCFIEHEEGADEIFFGPWVQPYGYKGQDGTWPVASHDPRYHFNWMHMHRSRITPGDFYIVDLINDARAFDMSMSIQIGEEAQYKTSGGGFIWEKYKQHIDDAASGETGEAITAAIADGTIESIYIADEPHASHHWQPTIPNQVVDDMGEYVKSKWPNVKTSVRAPLRHLESGARGHHDFKYIDYSYLNWSFDFWANWAGANRRSVEWFWETDFAFFAQQSNMKPRLMLQQGIGPRYQTMRTWTPFGYPDQSFDWFEETGLGENALWQQVLANDTYVYFRDSPDHMDYGAMSVLQKRNRETGALDPNGEVLVDAIGLFRWDRNGGSAKDAGNGTLPMPYTDVPLLRNNVYEIRDKIKAGPPYKARLIERHPEWDHHLDPSSSLNN